MAHSTLPVPSPSGFPPPYSGEFIDRIVSLADKAITRAELAELSVCAGESHESSVGAADGGFPCSKRPTISDPRTGQSWCVGCFEGVIL